MRQPFSELSSVPASRSDHGLVSIELPDRRNLVLLASEPHRPDTHSIVAFVNELRLAEERHRLGKLRRSDYRATRIPDEEEQ